MLLIYILLNYLFIVVEWIFFLYNITLTIFLTKYKINLKIYTWLSKVRKTLCQLAFNQHDLKSIPNHWLVAMLSCDVNIYKQGLARP